MYFSKLHGCFSSWLNLPLLATFSLKRLIQLSHCSPGFLQQAPAWPPHCELIIPTAVLGLLLIHSHLAFVYNPSSDNRQKVQLLSVLSYLPSVPGFIRLQPLWPPVSAHHPAKANVSVLIVILFITY